MELPPAEVPADPEAPEPEAALPEACADPEAAVPIALLPDAADELFLLLDMVSS